MSLSPRLTASHIFRPDTSFLMTSTLPSIENLERARLVARCQASAQVPRRARTQDLDDSCQAFAKYSSWILKKQLDFAKYSS